MIFYFAQTRDAQEWVINIGKATATNTQSARTVSIDEIENQIEYVYTVEADSIEQAQNPNQETVKIWTGTNAAAQARMIANRKW